MTGWRPRVVEVHGRFTRASNATLLGETAAGELVVYKPVAGERPLWDFAPETLAAREVLTYEISEAMGLGVVPETAFGEGPHGPGAVQRYVDADPAFDALTLVEAGDEVLWPLAVLDVICNNADRKVGHLLREAGTGRLLGIDHGLTFHHQDKLRTVLWGFAGRRFPEHLRGAVARLAGALGNGLSARVARLLGGECAVALEARVAAVVESPRHPAPPGERPPLPWPPY